MNDAASIALVRRYFNACNTGELDALRATLALDVVHYFLPERFAPIRGAEHLSRHWRKFKTALDPTWRIDRIIAAGDEVVSEWSCRFTPLGTGRRIMMRGTEWYVIRDGQIAEIRAYLIDDLSRDTGLIGFPYAERGYLVDDG